MARSDPLAERRHRRGLRRYLLDGERIVIANHHHWAKVALPATFVVAGLVLALVLDSLLPANLRVLTNLVWWAWFALVGWAIWRVLEWRCEWFVATDKRLILTYGLITQRVGMMPLSKVTDMSYTRSPLGRLLGYGTFVMESAGLDQALHKVRWVAQPDHTYRAICAEMFGVDDHERVLDGDVPPEGHEVPPEGRPDPAGHPHEPERPHFSPAIRMRAPGSKQGRSDSRDGPVRDADTGPIPRWPRSADPNDD